MTRKVKISFLIVVWSIVAIQIYVNYQERMKKENQAVTAFSVVEDSAAEETISGYGYFGRMEIAENIKENMLENLAYKLGITDGYTLTSGSGEDYKKNVLLKEGKNAVTTIQLISMYGQAEEPEQYIVLEIRTKEKIEKGNALYQKVKRVYEEIGVDAQVSMEIATEKKGNMITEEKGGMADEMFGLLDAEEVDTLMKNGIYTVYGYSKLEDTYLELNHKKVNIQLVMSYDEEEDKTYVKIGVPIVNTSY